MELLNVRLLAALLVAAFLNLDRQAVGQNMVSRPLVTGLLVGAVLEQPKAGLILGLWTEILWVFRANLGGVLVPNGGIAVSAALLAFSILTRFDGAFPMDASLPLFFVLIPPVAYLALSLEMLSRRASKKGFYRLRETLAKGKGVLFWANFKGLLFTLFASLAALVFFAPLLSLLVGLCLKLDPIWLGPALEKIAPCLPIVGLTIAVGQLSSRAVVFFVLGLGAGFSANLWP
ncbi:MAG: PTS sugar transporter subunit IIC [Deltaproteobacteria bacterium]|jgi:mannose/fructose/N-acetylgalactosamine-specific phosphotransferase system component IIC|nr:PTS sugar transporter subunit IIC [Deltaproteobacteria bacterium]